MSRRSEQLRTVAQDFCKMHADWVKDENRVIPDEIYWDGVDTLRESFASGDIPEDCRRLAEAVRLFNDEVAAFDDRDTGDLLPPDSFWEAREGIERALSTAAEVERSLPPLESIAALRELNPRPDDSQIAKIWGFVDRHGYPLPHLVQKELEKPGSVTNTPGSVDGRDWEDPRLARRRKKRPGNEAAERHAAISEKRKKAARSVKPAKETPRELWEIGLHDGKARVSVEQAAKMLGKPESEVAQLFQQFEDELAEKQAAKQAAEVPQSPPAKPKRAKKPKPEEQSA